MFRIRRRSLFVVCFSIHLSIHLLRSLHGQVTQFLFVLGGGGVGSVGGVGSGGVVVVVVGVVGGGGVGATHLRSRPTG